MNNTVQDLDSAFLTFFSIDKNTYLHKHSYKSLPGYPFHRIGLILKGNVILKTEIMELEGKENDVLFIPSNTSYSSRWSGSPEIEFYSISYSFKTSDISRKEYTFKEQYKLQVIDNPKKEIFTLFDKLYSNFNMGENFIFLALSNFYLLYNLILDYVIFTKTPVFKTSVDRAIEFINNNPSMQFDVPFLAGLCNMSESLFYRSFRKETGHTPVDFKNRVLINKAIEMLSVDNYTIEFISDFLGFSSPSYFHRIFKKYSGETPLMYKRIVTSI